VRVLVACEYSGAVRDAFLRVGHYAMSCDLLPSESSAGDHHQGDVRDVLHQGWDLLIAHPPCTYLTNSANGHLYRTEPSKSLDVLTGPERWQALIEGAVFFRQLLDAPIAKIAVENPVMNGYARSIVGRRHDQIVQPWMFGHPETKATGLWLKGLPPLMPTDDVRDIMATLPAKERARIHHLSPSADRWKIRSTTYPGIAAAMADQWGSLESEAAA
jgi:hypothetical protein